MKEIIYAKETFVPVKGYEDRIAITKNGRIFSLKSNKILKTTIFPNGYEVLCLMFQKPKRHTKTLCPSGINSNALRTNSIAYL